MTVVYDAGVLVAADRNDRSVWADHRVLLELGMAPVVTAPVVGQVSRSGRQVQLRRFLRGCDFEPFTAEQAHEVGELLARTATSDVVDAHVVVVASRLNRTVVTGDPDGIEALAASMPEPVDVRAL